MSDGNERIGSVLGGKYRLNTLLAEGGMGLVYAAQHLATGREVAIKVLRRELAGRSDLERRVSKEARLAVEARHPNVVEVLDAGADRERIPYLVLERLYGETLELYLGSPLDPLTTARALLPIMNAVSRLHACGIVHRDIKPSNLFLHVSDGRVTPKLLDFGIAKALLDSDATRTGVALGTPAYMAPEQALGYRDVGRTADVWAMGVVIVRALTGKLPESTPLWFRRESGALLLPGIEAGVARVLARALRVEPDERPSSMLAFRDDWLSALRRVSPESAWPDPELVAFEVSGTPLAESLAARPDSNGSSTADGRSAATRTLERQSRVVRVSPRRLVWLLAAGLPLAALALRPSARAPSEASPQPLLANAVANPAVLAAVAETEAPAPVAEAAGEARGSPSTGGSAGAPGLPAREPPSTRPGKARPVSPRPTPPPSSAAVLGTNRSPILE